MKILVADKDAKLRRLVKTRMEARGYQVQEESVSELVIRHLSRESVDLILLSTEMERIDGKLLIETIRKSPHLSSIPVVMLTEENRIAELILSQRRGFDDFLIKPFSPLVLQLRVALNIDQARKRIEANALTQLPGNSTIERMIRERIQSGEKYSVLYLDINNFKSFNDRYGFKKGDDVIRQTARMLIQVAQQVNENEEDTFVGHVGGDDFIVILTPEVEETYARAFIETFDRVIPTYYNEEDRKSGQIRVTNRRGDEETFPLMSCSIAACTNLYRQFRNIGEIAQEAAEVKKFLKSQPGSHYLRDRREAPMKDFEEAMNVLRLDIVDPKEASVETEPLGRTLLNAGLINETQLAEALEKNLKTGKRLGEVLVTMNAVASEDLGKILEKKLDVPYISLRHFVPSRDILRLFSRDFIKTRRIIPLQSDEKGLKLAMCDPFDIKTVDAIDRITQLKTLPHLALEDEFDEFVKRHVDGEGNPFEEKIG